MTNQPVSWYHLASDVRLVILSKLSLSEAISLNKAYPSSSQTEYINHRLDSVRILHQAWVNANQPTLHCYSNPTHLRTRAARAAFPLTLFCELSCLPLAGSGLSSLRGISEFKNLKSLDVSHNSLKKVDNELAQCKQLRVLNLGKNQLHSFPQVVFNLPQLRTLLLYSNSIPVLPENWDTLPYLHRLGLFNCGITDPLPEQLCQMLGTQTDNSRCRSANLQNNKFDPATIITLFSKFPKLKSSVVI